MPDTPNSLPKTLAIIATYNEMENLPELVETLFEHAPEIDVLVVDDASPDGTGDWVDEKARTEPRLRCLHREGKLGLGTAIAAGMQYGIEHGYEYIINLDGDFSHHPKYLPQLTAGMEGDPPTDVMIGSRYAPGGGVEGWPRRRRMMSLAVNWLARWTLGLSVRDCSGAFRCYRASRLAELDFTRIRARGYAFLEEILWRLKRQGCRFGETPIVFTDRERGKSKINWKEAVAALWIFFSLGVSNLFPPPKPASPSSH